MATTVKIPQDPHSDFRKSFLDAETVDVQPNERIIVSRITTDMVDRDGEVVVPKGLDFSEYEQNSVVTWAHDYSRLPIAHNAWLRREPKGVLAATSFKDHDDEFSEKVYQLYDKGHLKGWSIGFRAEKSQYGPPSQKEVADNPHWGAARTIIRKAMLLEYAAVNIPCNPGALTVSYITKSFHMPDSLAKELGITGMVEELAKSLSVEPAKPSEPERPKVYSFSTDDLLRATVREIKKNHDKIRKQLAAEWPEMLKEGLHVARGGV